MGRHLQMDHSGLAFVDLLYQAVSEISRYHKLLEFAGSGSGDPQLPYGKLHHLGLVTVINSYHRLLFICKSAVADLLVFVGQKFHRASQQFAVFFVNPDNVFMEIDQFLIFSPPGIRPSVIRIRKSAQSRLVSIRW